MFAASLLLLTLVQGSPRPERQMPDLVTGTVSDAGGPLVGTFVGVVRESDVLALPGDWERVPLWNGAVTDASGAYSVSLDGLAVGELYWVLTGSLEHFNEWWSEPTGGIGGLTSLPTRGDLQAAAPLPISFLPGTRAGVDFLLTGPSVLRDVPVPVGNGGVTLLTDVYMATDGSRQSEGTWGDPVVLARSPYDKGGNDPNDPASSSILSNYVSMSLMGYTVVLQNTRGRNGSTGTTEVFRTDSWGGPDQEDGYDTIEWIAAQSWSDGHVGVIGPSALAITGYLAGGAAPEALKAAYVWAGTPDVYAMYFDGGIYREEAMEGWLSGQLGGPAARDAYLLMPGSVVDNPHRSTFWSTVDVGTRLGLVRVPMLHVVGWYDLFGQAGMRAFQELQALGGTADATHAGAFGTQRLLVGPWSHVDWFNATQGDLVFPPSAGPVTPGDPSDPDYSTSVLYRNELRFFDHWLRLDPRGLGAADGYEDEPAVMAYQVGNTDPGGAGNEWRTHESWPPPELNVQPLRMHFLSRGSGLLELPASASELPLIAGFPKRLSFTHDPLDPVPTIGGPLLFATGNEPAGPRDQAPIEARDDVLSFSTGVLAEPLELAGEVSVHLAFSSDALDTDFVVKLTDVYPDGRSILVAVGALQARYRNGTWSKDDLLSGDPSQVYALDLSLGEVYALFDAGHRLRIDVASSDYPRLKPNPGTGASFFPEDLDAGNSVPARNSIWCATWLRYRSSWVDLPVVR